MAWRLLIVVLARGVILALINSNEALSILEIREGKYPAPMCWLMCRGMLLGIDALVA